MSKKQLVYFSLISWAIIGLFYGLYLIKYETVLIGALRELTIIPAFFGSFVFPLILVVRIIREKLK